MLKKIYTIISPFHFFLLIPFFLLHNVNYYFGLIPIHLVYNSFFAYFALTISIFLVVKVILKSNLKAGIYTFVAMGYFFGFGAVKDFLDASATLQKIASYRYMLPTIVILLVLLLVYLKKTERDFKKLNTFLFIAITANLLLEIVLWSKNKITGAEKNNDLGDPELTLAKSFSPCNDCDQPDIFYIIFDEYSSSLNLRENFNYNNHVLDDFLAKENFFVSEKSRSNYGFTAFSVASVLDMVYLDLAPGHVTADSRDIARGEYSVFKSDVIKILEKQGYNIHNHSIFDLENHPSLLGTYFYGLRKMFLNDETLLGRTKRDIGWNVARFRSKKYLYDSEYNFRKKVADKTSINLNTSFNLAIEAIEKQDLKQKDFFYFHFILPHDPFVFDSTGKTEIYWPSKISPKEKYLAHIKYANKKIIELVSAIQKKYNGKAVILLQGDHGYKQWPGDPNYLNVAFQNLNAVYLPDKNYSQYYDGVSPVNTFRLLFNHYFNTNYDILPDKIVEIFLLQKLKKNYGIKQDNK